jgi:DNA polymerase-3 subunit epsilon
MIPLDRISFVDLETTGLSPTRNRITEIGVVMVDATGVNEWTTLINPGTPISEHSRLFNGIANEVVRDAPRFKDIAAELSRMLSGRLFIAHNARFDFGFLRAEFQRLGIEFQPQVLCSVMLSRKLYPALAGHDLDTLMQRHGLTAEVRHRALPDAQLIWQFWQVLHAHHSAEQLETVIEVLLAGPVLPAHLDPSLIDRLPEAPGVYVLHGGDDTILHVGKAGNLKLHLINYFRLDRTSAKALAVSHEVRNITWRTTRGTIGAHLKLKELSLYSPFRKNRAARALYSWRLTPESYPCVELISLTDRASNDGESFGVFDSERKARNALLRLASSNNLCHAALGIRENPEAVCTGCAFDDASRCGVKKERLKHLSKAVAALAPWRVAQWPYAGPIGIKERTDLHILEDWRYLGTAQSEDEIHSVLESRQDVFDEETFEFLAKTLARLPRRRIVQLPGRTDSIEEIEPTTT